MEPAGFYSYDLLDNLGRPSARRVLPQFQYLAVGDWVPMGGKPTPSTAYRVTRLEPGTLMLWESLAAPGCGCSSRPAPGRPGPSPGCAAVTTVANPPS